MLAVWVIAFCAACLVALLVAGPFAATIFGVLVATVFSLRVRNKALENARRVIVEAAEAHEAEERRLERLGRRRAKRKRLAAKALPPGPARVIDAEIIDDESRSGASGRLPLILRYEGADKPVGV